MAENPQFSFAMWELGSAYEAVGDAGNSLDINIKALEVDGRSELAGNLRKIKDTDGIDAANRYWLEEAIRRRTSQIGVVPAYDIAERAAAVKDREQTLYWLEKAYEEPDATVGTIKFYPKFDFVRDDPRFQAIVNKLPF